MRAFIMTCMERFPLELVVFLILMRFNSRLRQNDWERERKKFLFLSYGACQVTGKICLLQFYTFLFTTDLLLRSYH